MGNKIKDLNPVMVHRRVLNAYKSSVGIWMNISEFCNRFSYLDITIQFVLGTPLDLNSCTGQKIRTLSGLPEFSYFGS